MIKIQLRPVKDESDRFVSPEYIWIEGNGPWPVSLSEEQNVLKVEVFGEELSNTIVSGFGDSTDIENEVGHVVYRTWIKSHARYVCAQMRARYQ